MIRCTLQVRGQVQGVGFRPFVYRVARELGVRGAVWNDQTGVFIDTWASPETIAVFKRRLTAEAPALARIDSVRCHEQATPDGELRDGFEILTSDVTAAERGRVTVDSAVCPDCVREMFTPDDRRFRHALINCTNCGPRYTIVQDLPYDRSRTTMSGFAMCAPCAAEYGDPADRRFHAQPTCCPECGPQLRLVAASGRQIPGDPTAGAAAIVAEGGILAMKGLGGYHLVLDARREAAVTRLRKQKRRDHKPFAIMVRTLDHASRLVRLSSEACALLQSPRCPIVLANRVADSDDAVSIAPSVAPDCHRLGVMLPYTPMQHLLFADLALRDAVPVMTSANFSDDPLISDDADATQRLTGLCDAFLLHDRPIERAVDDSIVIDASFGIMPLRRARGYVPEPIPLPVPAPGPGLCTGGELKNTSAVVRGNEAILSQHIGDLTWSLAYQRFEGTIEDLRRLYDVQFEWVACDMHPRYAARTYARRLAARLGIGLIEVQHHHAHLASLLAEHQRTDPIVGIVCDGVGYGTDGTAWGGEIMVGGLTGSERVARLRPLLLPGGDAAAKRTGRCTASWLADAAGIVDPAHPVLRQALPDDRERELVLRLIDARAHCPASSGAGRLFDAAAALLGICTFNHHEAMSGMMLEARAVSAESPPSGEGIVVLHDRDDLVEIDHRPLARRLLEMVEHGEPIEGCAWVFHDALADGLARAAVRVADRSGIRTVGLSGGVFCNELLTRLVLDRLEGGGFEVLVHRAVPANDGGIALGQAAVAAAVRSSATAR